MKRLIDIKLVKFYLWIALAYLFLGVYTTVVDYPGQFFDIVVNNIWANIYVTALNFILFEYTIPFIFKKRKVIVSNILWGILLFGVHLMLYSFGFYVWRYLGLQIHVYTSLKAYTEISEVLQNQMAYSMMSVFFYGIIRHIYRYIKLKNNAQQLKIEKQAAELNYLRSQTNPHFLFNTLNNIYSLARDKSDLAPKSILQLSKILRFMLYETDGSFISIEQELTIIDDYIALEKLRYDNSLQINLDYNVKDKKQAIPPLLLISLVENAFKHGVSESREQTFVDINLSVNNQLLTFIVKNSSEVTGKDELKEKIGLSNIRRQLELLYKDYDLSVIQDISTFTATLKINLTSHV